MLYRYKEQSGITSETHRFLIQLNCFARLNEPSKYVCSKREGAKKTNTCASSDHNYI